MEQSIETCSISAHTLGLNLTIILFSLSILNEKIKIMKIIQYKISQIHNSFNIIPNKIMQLIYHKK